MTVVVTCRSDEAPLEPQVAEWLTHVRGRGGVAEVRLGPLSRDEVAEQVAGLAGSPASAPVVDELYARAEGNPFFTEQLVAAWSLAGGCAASSASRCRRGWRSCWWRGRLAAARRPGRCCRRWRWRAGRWVRICSVLSAGWMSTLSAAGCGS